MSAVYDTPEGEILRELETLASRWETKIVADKIVTGAGNPAISARQADVDELRGLVKRVWSRLNHRRKAEGRAA